MMVMALIYINSLAILIGFELNVSINSIKILSDKRTDIEKNIS
jgi:membrane protein